MAIPMITAEAAKRDLPPLSTLLTQIYLTLPKKSFVKFYSVDRYCKLVQTLANLEFANKSLAKFASVD